VVAEEREVAAHALDRIPALAGIATYAEAAHIGYSVDENVARLLRFHWVERRLMATLVAHLTAEPVWEVKCAIALHQWQCAEHVMSLRVRIGEMRHPAPKLDVAPDAALDRFLDELVQSTSTAELLAGVYDVAYTSLADAYRTHIEVTNPLVDYPTRRLLRIALGEIEDAVEWGARALDAICRAHPTARAEADAWSSHLRALLAAGGGITGNIGVPQSDGVTDAKDLPKVVVLSAAKDLHLQLRSTQPFKADFHPRRDERFTGAYDFDFPPHVVYNTPGIPADERNLALLCKRALEMDVPEMMASFMTERAGQAWEFYYDYSRQLWDEARHAMMGTVALEAKGIDWKREVPLNVSFALRLNLHATPLERQIMLFAIEQSLMPGETGKRFEYETACEAGDELSAHFHDYDWADEVLHAQIGRRMLRRDGITSDEVRDRAAEIHERTWAALDQYRTLDSHRSWWPAFVRRVLGHVGSDMVLGMAPPTVVSE
jgi:hypothetical protein